MNFVKTGDGRFIELQGTAEGQPFDRRALDALMELADNGIKELIDMQRAIVGDFLKMTVQPWPPARSPRPTRGRSARSTASSPDLPIELMTLDGLSRHPRARGDRRDVRRERAAQGALLLGGDRAAGGRRRLGDRDRGARQRARRALGAVARRATTRPSSRRSTASWRRAGSRRSAARFVAHIALAHDGAILFEATGIIEGEIAPGAARDARLRLRPDLLLPAVRLHAGRGGRC